MITLLRKRPFTESTAVDNGSDSSIACTNKTFLRKSAQGRVIKVLREHYLRPDIPCGSAYCDVCIEQGLYDQQVQQTLAGTSRDPATLAAGSSLDHDEMDTSRRAKRLKRGGNQAGPVLSRNGRDPISALPMKRHYLLLDTNIVLHQVCRARVVLL